MVTQRLRYSLVANLVSFLLPDSASAQYRGPPAQFSCYRYFGEGIGVVASAGVSNNDLCATTGAFWSLVSSGQSCLSRSVTNVPAPNFDQVNSVLARCNSEVSESSRKLCESLSAVDDLCIVQSSYFAQAAVATTASRSASVTTSSAAPVHTLSTSTVPRSTTQGASVNDSSLVVSQTQTATHSPTPEHTGEKASEDKNGTNVDLIIGVAVGAALGTVILVSFLVVCLWRYRKQRQQKLPISFQPPPTLPPRPPPPTYEAKKSLSELDSPTSDYTAAYNLQRKVRALSGLQELEGANPKPEKPWMGMYSPSYNRDPGMRTWYSSGTSEDDFMDRL